MYYVVFIGLILSLFITIFLYEYVKYLFHKQKPLFIETPDGYHQPYHPSVLYFEDKFNGYKYWMAFSPYPINADPYTDRWETPCICCSNDGLNWEIPKGLINPIDDLNYEEVENKDFMSDPHLVFNYNKRELECWYRITHNKNGLLPTFVLRKTSQNGINWYERQLLIDLQKDYIINNSVGDMVRSPAIIYINNKYDMWYVDTLPFVKESRNLCLSHSKNAKNWTKKELCSLNGRDVNPWHIDIQHINGEYLLLIYEQNNELTLWKSSDGLKFNFDRLLLKPTKVLGSVYSKSLYRSCIIYNKDEYLIYFSAGNGKEHNVGLIKSVNLKDFNVVNVEKGKKISTFCTDFYKKYTDIPRRMKHKLFN